MNTLALVIMLTVWITVMVLTAYFISKTLKKR